MAEPLIEEVLLDCDSTTAFDLMADVRNEARWNTTVSLAELRSEGPIGEGSKFVTVYRGVENEVTLTEFDRPDRLVVVAVNDRMEIDTTYAFAEENGGTRLSVATEVESKGALTSSLSPLLRLFMRREVAKKYATVKRIIESRTDAS